MLKKLLAAFLCFILILPLSLSVFAENDGEYDKFGHEWGEWTIIKEPTGKEPGLRQRTCKNLPETLIITLDAGHTKNDNKGVISGYSEGTRMFELMLKLKEELEVYKNVEIHLTRNKVTDDPTLIDRGMLAVNTESKVFISLHSNFYDLQKACGVSVYRSFLHPESDELGTRIGLAITELMNEQTGVTIMRGDDLTMIRTEPAEEEGVGKDGLQDYYSVVRNSTRSEKCIYSYIVEHGFHSNTAECTFLMSDENLQLLAKTEADVIATYFDLYKEGEESKYIHTETEEIPPLKQKNKGVSYNIPANGKIDGKDVFPDGAAVVISDVTEEYENYEGFFVFSAYEYSAVCDNSDFTPVKTAVFTYTEERSRPARIMAVYVGEGGVFEETEWSYNGSDISINMEKTGVYLLGKYPRGEHTPGDVNGDGSVNNKDISLLFKYLSYDTVDVVIDAIDINNDGFENNKDLMDLFKFLSENNQMVIY